MRRKTQDVVSELNVFVNGVEFLGVCPNFKLPNITQTMIEQAGALKGKVGSGIYEPLEITLKLNEINASVYESFALNNTKKHVPLALRESIHKQGVGDLRLAAEIKGEFEALEINEDSVGAVREVTLKIWADFCTVKQAGRELIYYDRFSNEMRLNGVDMMKDIRKNLEL